MISSPCRLPHVRTRVLSSAQRLASFEFENVTSKAHPRQSIVYLSGKQHSMSLTGKSQRRGGLLAQPVGGPSPLAQTPANARREAALPLVGPPYRPLSQTHPDPTGSWWRGRCQRLGCSLAGAGALARRLPTPDSPGVPLRLPPPKGAGGVGELPAGVGCRRGIAGLACRVRATCRTAWSCRSVWSDRHPVKVEAAGSNPVRTAATPVG